MSNPIPNAVPYTVTGNTTEEVKEKIEALDNILNISGGGGDLSDYYTKEQSDAKYATINDVGDVSTIPSPLPKNVVGSLTLLNSLVASNVTLTQKAYTEPIQLNLGSGDVALLQQTITATSTRIYITMKSIGIGVGNFGLFDFKGFCDIDNGTDFGQLLIDCRVNVQNNSCDVISNSSTYITYDQITFLTTSTNFRDPYFSGGTTTGYEAVITLVVPLPGTYSISSATVWAYKVPVIS